MDNKQYPLVTIAILSWNRLHYLKSTVESARECIKYPNIEWIISDNNSSEEGLTEYIQSLNWVDFRLVKGQSHASAMNQLVSIASGKYILIWPEDIQFVKRGDWLLDVIEVLESNPNIGSVGLNYLRQVTNRNLFTRKRWRTFRLIAKELFYFRHKFRFSFRVSSRRGFELRTLGHLWPGVCGSGIPTLTRTALWREMGKWLGMEKRDNSNLLDSSLGAEADMVRRFYEKGDPFQQAVLSNPVAADIVTDPIGSKAKVRGDKRYGVYFPPVSGSFYYKITDMKKFSKPEVPLSFEENVNPIGFDLPKDQNGNLLKADRINLDVYSDLPPEPKLKCDK